MSTYWRDGAVVSRAAMSAAGLAAALALLGTTAEAAPQFGYPFYYAPAYRSYQPQVYAPALPPDVIMPRRRRAVTPKLPDAPPKETARPQGTLTLVISIEKQRVRVYDNGKLFAESPISSGTAGHATPTGIFSVIGKEKFHRSNLYSNAPMPYMQRITWSGVALHEGVLPGYPASHGCIRLPREFALKLWSWTKMGARVVIAPGDVMPGEVNHPNLLALGPTTQKAADATPQLRLTPLGVRTADATGTAPVVIDAKPSDEAADPDALISVTEKLAMQNAKAKLLPPPPRPNGQLAVFVSRKDRRIYVRQGFEPWFDMPITITRSLDPIGTHVFTALPADGNGSALRWSALTLPDTPRLPPASKPRRGEAPKPAEKPVTPVVSAGEALDRIAMPNDALERIGNLWKPGASLVVSDQGLGDETGRGTDFIVVTR